MTIQQGFSSCKWHKMTLWELCWKGPDGAVPLKCSRRLERMLSKLFQELWRFMFILHLKNSGKRYAACHSSGRTGTFQRGDQMTFMKCIPLYTHIVVWAGYSDVGAWRRHGEMDSTVLMFVPVSCSKWTSNVFRITHFCFKEGKILMEDGNFTIRALKNATPA